MFISVDLPQPDGPMIATNSPSLISNVALSRAMVSTSSVRKILERFVTVIILFRFFDVNDSVFLSNDLHSSCQNQYVADNERMTDFLGL